MTIAFLGDSITLGYGLEHKENRYSTLVSQALKMDELNYGIWDLFSGADTSLYWIARMILCKSDIYELVEEDSESFSRAEELWNFYLNDYADSYKDNSVLKIKTPAFND